MMREHSPPKIQTDTAQTIIAIIAPFDSVMPPEELPAAPASESPPPVPADDPTSPGAGPGQLLAIWPVKEVPSISRLTISRLLWR